MPTREESGAEGAGRPGAAHGPRRRGAVAVPLAAAAGDGVRGRPLRELAGGRAVRLPGAGARSARPATCCWRCAGSPTPSGAFDPASAAGRVGAGGVAPRAAARGGRGAGPGRASRAGGAGAGRGQRSGGRAGAVGAAAARRTAARPPLRDRRWCTSTGPRRCAGWAIAAPARRAWARTQELLEELADEFERRGPARAGVRLLRHAAAAGARHGLVRERGRGLPERHPAAGRRRPEVLRARSTTRTSWPTRSRAASGRRPPPWRARRPNIALKVGLLYERHYRQRAASLFAEAARQTMAAGGPSEMAENALVAAIDVSAALGDLVAVRGAVRRGGRAAARPEAQGTLRRAGGAASGPRASGRRPGRRSRITCAAPTPTRTSGART